MRREDRVVQAATRRAEPVDRMPGAVVLEASARILVRGAPGAAAELPAQGGTAAQPVAMEMSDLVRAGRGVRRGGPRRALAVAGAARADPGEATQPPARGTGLVSAPETGPVSAPETGPVGATPLGRGGMTVRLLVVRGDVRRGRIRSSDQTADRSVVGVIRQPMRVPDVRRQPARRSPPGPPGSASPGLSCQRA